LTSGVGAAPPPWAMAAEVDNATKANVRANFANLFTDFFSYD
jgi:hypothetical protein